ncbi:MAG: DHH family phosphoesterase, partial [Planctomycetota bacterium]
MSVYESNATMGDLARRLDAARRVLLTTHEKPDGDALGSVVALHRALAARGRDPEIWLAGPVDRGLDTVLDGTPVRRLEDGAPGDDHDLAVVADTGAWSQLRTIAPWLRRHHERVIGLDHHRLGDDVAAWRVVDPACAATTQLVVRLLDELGWEITGGPGGLAEPLFAGLATDTGWFRYSNADADAFAVAARLLACGVDNSRLHQRIEETHAPSRLGLEARALASLAYAADGTVAVMSLARADFDATGGTPADLTSIVNRPMVVARVRASALL